MPSESLVDFFRAGTSMLDALTSPTIPRYRYPSDPATGGLDIVIAAAARVLAEGFLTVLGDCAVEYRNPKRINDDEIAAELVHFSTPRFVIASEIVANHGNRVELLHPGAR